MVEALAQPKELAALATPRIGMLAACILVAMGSGTNYVSFDNVFPSPDRHLTNSGQAFSGEYRLIISRQELSCVHHLAYAPQLGERLKLTHTQLNIVGIAGNSTRPPSNIC